MRMTDNRQMANRDEWLLDRHGLITGTRAKTLTLEKYAPKPTKTLEAKLAKDPDDTETVEKLKEAHRLNERYKVPRDFWALIGERLGDPITDGLPPMQRGTVLESENIAATVEKVGLDPSTVESDPSMWVDDSLRLAVSPDAHEKTSAPTWAIECKSLGYGEHVRAVVQYMTKEHPERFPADLWPVIHDALDDSPMAGVPEQYRAQVVQYFVVNPDLKVLYFSLYLPELGNLGHVVIPIHREAIGDVIEAQRVALMETVAWVSWVADTIGEGL